MWGCISILLFYLPFQERERRQGERRERKRNGDGDDEKSTKLCQECAISRKLAILCVASFYIASFLLNLDNRVGVRVQWKIRRRQRWTFSGPWQSENERKAMNIIKYILVKWQKQKYRKRKNAANREKKGCQLFEKSLWNVENFENFLFASLLVQRARQNVWTFPSAEIYWTTLCGICVSSSRKIMKRSPVTVWWWRSPCTAEKWRNLITLSWNLFRHWDDSRWQLKTSTSLTRVFRWSFYFWLVMHEVDFPSTGIRYFGYSKMTANSIVVNNFQDFTDKIPSVRLNLPIRRICTCLHRTEIFFFITKFQLLLASSKLRTFSYRLENRLNYYFETNFRCQPSVIEYSYHLCYPETQDKISIWEENLWFMRVHWINKEASVAINLVLLKKNFSSSYKLTLTLALNGSSCFTSCSALLWTFLFDVLIKDINQIVKHRVLPGTCGVKWFKLSAFPFLLSRT